MVEFYILSFTRFHI